MKVDPVSQLLQNTHTFMFANQLIADVYRSFNHLDFVVTHDGNLPIVYMYNH